MEADGAVNISSIVGGRFGLTARAKGFFIDDGSVFSRSWLICQIRHGT
jgi:hypothetical protein